MSVPGGLAESAASTLVRLMTVELAGVDIGYASRFAALGTTGDKRAARSVEARLTTDARCLEAAVTTALSEVTNVAPVEVGTGLHPLSASQVYYRWQELIEGWLASGHLRAAELNAFLAEFADPAEDGDQLLTVITDLDRCRQDLWQNTRRPTGLPNRDLYELQKLDGKRQQLYALIRSRYPVAVRADHVQTALQRQYESQRAELLATRDQYTSREDQAGYATALEQLDSAYELALRRQSVAGYEVQSAPSPPSPVPGPMAVEAGQVMQTVLAQMEQQRAELVRMRDQDLTAQGRAAYDQAIAQIDVSMEVTRRQPSPAVKAEPPMTDDQRRAAEEAIAAVAKATAQLNDLGTAMRAGSAVTAHMMAQSNALSGLNAELHVAGDERVEANRAMQNAKLAMDKARLAGLQADYQAATRHYEQSRQRYATVEARFAELQARIGEQRQRLLNGPQNGGDLSHRPPTDPGVN